MNKFSTTPLILAMTVLLSACTGTPTLENKPSSEFQGLNEVSSSGFRQAWARPGAKLGQYKVLVVDELSSASTEIKQPQTSARIHHDWELTPRRQAALAQTWSESMAAAAGKHGITTGETTEEALRVAARLTRIAPSANMPADENLAGRSTVYTEDSGEAAIEIRLFDQRSGELLAVIRDERRIGPRMWHQASTIKVAADVRHLFNTWANQLLLRIIGSQAADPG